METTTTIEKLNLFLRDELAAVETYDEALRGRSAATGKRELSLCQRSHERRVAALRTEIAALGGTPASPPVCTAAGRRCSSVAPPR